MPLPPPSSKASKMWGVIARTSGSRMLLGPQAHDIFLFLSHTSTPYTYTPVHNDSGVCVPEDTCANRLALEQPQPGGAIVAVVEDKFSP